MWHFSESKQTDTFGDVSGLPGEPSNQAPELNPAWLVTQYRRHSHLIRETHDLYAGVLQAARNSIEQTTKKDYRTITIHTFKHYLHHALQTCK